MLGLFILSMRIGKSRIGQHVARLYVELFQGTPLLMQLFLIFFGLGLFGLDVPAWLAAGLALVCWTAAFLAEIWRGCVESIPKGQWEAGSSLALTRPQQMRLIILPQALRIAIPPTTGFSVQVVKGTAVTSIIGFVEVSKAGTIVTNATFEPFTVYGLVALIYFVISFPFSKFSKWLEFRMAMAYAR